MHQTFPLSYATLLNKRKLLCSLLSIILSASTFAQEQEKVADDVTHITKATFLNPGISYEHRVGKRQTVYLQGFMNTSAYFMYSNALGTSAGINFDPAFTVQYRYYYNAAKRQARGKRTEMNSLNYIAPVWESTFIKDENAKTYFNENKRLMANQLGAVWGIQRNYKKRFSLDLNLGLGYLFYKETSIDDEGRRNTNNISEVAGMGQLNLGFWLNKRK